jgi:hypothetical protein
MILPEAPPSPLQPPEREGYELDPALEQEQWLNDFIERLNYTIEDIVRKK